MKRFPTRTLVLMALTLLAFGWMYWQTHANPPPKHERHDGVQVITLPLDGGRAGLEQALRDALDGSGLIRDNAATPDAMVQDASQAEPKK